MKRTTLTVLLALVFTISGFAADLVPLQSGVPAQPLQVVVKAETPHSLTIDITASGIMVENMTADASGHALLSWPNAGVEGRIGEARIPVRRMLVAIPYGATVIPSISSQSWSTHDLATLTGSTALMPVQPPREKIEGLVVPFTKNTGYYLTDSYSNLPTVEVEDYIVVRGQQMALVTVRPVQYNPAAAMLRIAEQLEIELEFAGGDDALTAAKAARYHDSRTMNLLQESTVNDIGREIDTLPASLGYYVIMPNDASVISTMAPYLDWKAAQGWDVIAALTSDIGSSTSAIKSYLQTAYDSADVPPSFVLLVGDTGVIPYWVGSGTGSPNTDLNYVQLEGADYMPDAGIGRFSIANITDLQNVINKTMNYEKVLWTGGDDWVTHSNFMASVDNYSISEGTHNYVLNNYLWPAGFTADRLYQVTFGATTADVTNSFNAGLSLGTYSGHGSEYSWADGPPFSQANVNALTNSVYPFVQSYACLTGSFQLGECFAETWMRHSSGSFAFMGSSVNSYWDEDDLMEKAVYEAFFDNQTPGDDYDITWINGMINYSKLALYQHYGNTGTVRRYCEMYNIMGDGSVDLWTTVPQSVTPSHPSAFFLGMDEITVSVPDAPTWARVCVQSSSQPEIIASGYTDLSGDITLVLPEAPTSPGTLNIYVTGHNINPYEAQIPLTASDGPYVVFESVVVNDAAGWNPNGQLDYGETAMLTVTVENVGVDPSGDPTSVQLTDVASMVAFSDNVETYPSIPAGGLISVPNGFTLTVDPAAADASVASVPVFIADSWDFWESNMPLTLNAPVAELGGLAISGDDNGNNWLDPGETATITVTLTNDGSSPIVNGFALLHENDDPYVQITTDNVEEFDLSPGASVDMSWGILATASCPQDYDVTLVLDLDGDHSYSVDVNVPMTVGDILRAPTGPDAYGYLAYDLYDGNNSIPYNWVEISPGEGGPGTDTGITGDDETVHHTLPFTFTYYGNDYNGLSIDSNGMIALGNSAQSSDYSNSAIPNADGPSAMIAPFWEDLNPSRPGSDGIYYYHDTVNNRYIVEWSHIDEYTPSGNYETFEVILYDPAHHPTTTGDGIIQFQYLDITNEINTSVTVGIESPSETDGLEYVYDGDYDVHAASITDGFSITLLTDAGDPLPAPHSLTYELNGDTVNLSWEFAGLYTFDQLTQPANVLPGDKVDVMREDDRLQIEDWLLNGVPVNELDEFLNFRVYRDAQLIGTPTITTFEDTPTGQDSYDYFVTAWHDEGESLPSNTVTVILTGQMTLTVTPVISSVGASGGTIVYGAELNANNPLPLTGVDYWTMVLLPNGNPYGPVFEATFNLPANAVITRGAINQVIPAYAPAGIYRHDSYIGYYPNVVEASDFFFFTKTAGGDPNAIFDLTEWTCTGWDTESTVVSATEALPLSFEVGRAYPNPFNAQVSVPFALPNAGQVEIALYNVLGQQVIAQTINSEAGYQTFTIDGSALSSGVYLLSVNGFGTQQHQKLMLLK